MHFLLLVLKTIRPIWSTPVPSSPAGRSASTPVPSSPAGRSASTPVPSSPAGRSAKLYGWDYSVDQLSPFHCALCL